MLKRYFLVALVMGNFMTWQGCEYEVIPGPVDCEENPVFLEVESTEDSNCELSDGSIEVSASGGTGVYRFILGNEEPQESPAFEGLAAGVYEITVLDDNNCSATIEVTLRNTNGLNITFVTTEAGCNTTNGTLTVTAFDGTAPYQFKIDDGSFSTTNTFAGMMPGEYDLVVNDASGCSVSQTVKIKSNVSYAISIAPIITAKCAVNDCHNGTQFPDFRSFKNIHENASQIKVLTGNRTMPEDGTLTQTEINTIACWVDDGALEN